MKKNKDPLFKDASEDVKRLHAEAKKLIRLKKRAEWKAKNQ